MVANFEDLENSKSTGKGKIDRVLTLGSRIYIYMRKVILERGSFLELCNFGRKH